MEKAMICVECGATLPRDEICQDRFHALLGAESHNAELARMHGLMVLTYHVQHPSRTKAWYQEAAYDVLRRVFGQGQDWQEVLKGGRRYAYSAAFQQWKRNYGTSLLPEIVASPVPTEMTIDAINPDGPDGQADQVFAWARSVAEGRVLTGASAPAPAAGIKTAHL